MYQLVFALVWQCGMHELHAAEIVDVEGARGAAGMDKEVASVGADVGELILCADGGGRLAVGEVEEEALFGIIFGSGEEVGHIWL